MIEALTYIFSLFSLPRKLPQKHNASFPVEQNMDTHVANLIRKWRLQLFNTTSIHIKHMSHLRFSVANISPNSSSPRWSRSPTGRKSRIDESFRWISSGEFAMGVVMMEGSMKHNEPHGSSVYVHRMTPAFCLPGTLFTTAILTGEQERGGFKFNK